MRSRRSLSYEYDAVGNHTKLITKQPDAQLRVRRAESPAHRNAARREPANRYIHVHAGRQPGKRGVRQWQNEHAVHVQPRNQLTGISHKLGATLLLGVAYTLDPRAAHRHHRNRRDQSHGHVRLRRREAADEGERRQRRRVIAERHGRRQDRQPVDVRSRNWGRSVRSPARQRRRADYDSRTDRLESEILAITGTVPGATPGTTTADVRRGGEHDEEASPTETVDYVYDDAKPQWSKAATRWA